MRDIALGPGTLDWLGTTYRTILTTEDSAGAMSIIDAVSPPGSGPPRHIHHDADETFVLLTGDAEFWLEDARFTRGPGETVFIPRGAPHTFRVVSDVPCRHLIFFTPGGFEGFFAEMARGGYRIPQDMEAIAEIGAQHHLSFTGPPLAAD